ncbi:MAG TPA: hypothetical protein VGQ83_38505 [Polyangia bacterium]|jgi:hypothetical protein
MDPPTAWGQSLWGSSANDVWAVGYGTTAWHFRGALPRLGGGACPQAIPVYCGSTVAGGNASGASIFSSYGCPGASGETGPEVYYRFASPITGTVAIHLAPGEGDLDLMVTGSDGAGGCDPAGACLGTSRAGGTSPEDVTISVTAGSTYYIIVDGFGGVTSAYSLGVTCTRP